MGFSGQEYWSGWPCSPAGDLPDPGIEPVSLTSPALAGGFFTTSTTWENLKNPSPDSIKCWIKLSLLPGPSCLASPSPNLSYTPAVAPGAPRSPSLLNSARALHPPSILSLSPAPSHWIILAAHVLRASLECPFFWEVFPDYLFTSASPSLKRFSALCSQSILYRFHCICFF